METTKQRLQTHGAWIAWWRAARRMRKLEAETTKKALDSLRSHGLVEDMKREETDNFKFLTTRWEKSWRMKDGEWKMKVRFVVREYNWAEHHEDLFSLDATHSAGPEVDFIALKLVFDLFEADAVDVYNHAPEYEHVIVDPAPGYLKRLVAAGKNTDVLWRLRRQLPGPTDEKIAKQRALTS